MRLTRAAEYAVRCVLHLSRQGQGTLTSRQEVALQADIPAHFLVKIAQDLARAGLIEIRQGARGGLLLRRDPAAISLLEVVEAIIGEIRLNDCVALPTGCPASGTCAVHRVWLDARDQLRATLGRVSFEHLINAGCLSGYTALLGEPEGREATPSPPTKLQ